MGPKPHGAGRRNPPECSCSSKGGRALSPEDRPPVICVVDDDESLLRALRRLLRASGFRVETLPSAEEFLGSERRADAACLVVDVHLEGLSGLDLQERLVAAGTRIPVVVISARDDSPTRERARRAGAVDYLRKPFDGELLIGAINRAIHRG
jgi:FixJ family two-component response regulator